MKVFVFDHIFIQKMKAFVSEDNVLLKFLLKNGGVVSLFLLNNEGFSVCDGRYRW